jgi:hypothetical protein
MNPDFGSLPADATVAQALERVRDSELSPSQLLALWVIDAQVISSLSSGGRRPSSAGVDDAVGMSGTGVMVWRLRRRGPW